MPEPCPTGSWPNRGEGASGERHGREQREGAVRWRAAVRWRSDFAELAQVVVARKWRGQRPPRPRLLVGTTLPFRTSPYPLMAPPPMIISRAGSRQEHGAHRGVALRQHTFTAIPAPPTQAGCGLLHTKPQSGRRRLRSSRDHRLYWQPCQSGPAQHTFDAGEGNDAPPLHPGAQAFVGATVSGGPAAREPASAAAGYVPKPRLPQPARMAG